MKEKHAFLIMAHNHYSQLDKLLQLLDNERVDIFLHIDKKSPAYKLPPMKYSSVTEIKRISVTWGGYSQIQCELDLLNAALGKQTPYAYYHFLTGQDLPLRPINGILTFFDAADGKNFVHFDYPEKSLTRYERVRYWRFFQDVIGRKKNILAFLEYRILIFMQRKLKLDRTKKAKNICFKSGSAYFSITEDLAKYIVGNEKLIRSLFKFTVSGDEMFIQTLCYNSEYEGSLYDRSYTDRCRANMREIDWKRGAGGSPYTWQIDSLDELKASECMFARKFDEDTDNEIIEEIVKALTD